MSNCPNDHTHTRDQATSLVGGRAPSGSRPEPQRPASTPLVDGRQAAPAGQQARNPHAASSPARQPRRRRPVDRLVALAVAAVLVAGLAAGFATSCSVDPEEQADGTALVEDTTGDTEAEKEGEPVPQVKTGTYSGYELTALEGVEESRPFQNLQSTVAALNEQGIDVGIYLRDLSTGDSVTLNADQLFYPASSIKIAACTYAMETDAGASVGTSTLEACLVYSDNNAYYRVLDAYGRSNVTAWMQEHGVSRDIDLVSESYPDLTPAELASIWAEAQSFMASGQSGSDTLAGLLAQSEYSAAGELLRSGGTVESKPGWYPEDSYNCPATNDAGIVTDGTGSYLFVLMTTASEDFDAIKPVMTAMDGLYEAMESARAEAGVN